MDIFLIFTALFMIFFIYYTLIFIFRSPLLLLPIAKLTNSYVIYLQDRDGEISISLTNITPFNQVIAKRYWPTNIRIVTLQPNQQLKNGDYVAKWKYAFKKDQQSDPLFNKNRV
ncbi:MAG: hypothetical protein PVF17_04450 [Ignavibacteria bacterium]|jgi:hypothetical protein